MCVCGFGAQLGLVQVTVSYHREQQIDAGLIARENAALTATTASSTAGPKRFVRC